MSWLISAKQYIPAVIGEPFGGGYFAGYISHTANGVPTHALIVAPRETGATGTNYTLTTPLRWAANSNAPDGVNYSTTVLGGSFTGSITGTTMTVASGLTGKIRPGCTITGTGVATGTTVVSQTSGTTNGLGNYTVSISQNIVSGSLTAGTSEFDGVANGTLFKDIDNTVGSGSTIFPAANFCETLSIGGFTDWYLPARFEMDIAYFNLKPSTQANEIVLIPRGINVYSVPRRDNRWTVNYPTQTPLTTFNTTVQAFIAERHWSSTEVINTEAHPVEFSSGVHGINGKATTLLNVRAFRRIAL